MRLIGGCHSKNGNLSENVLKLVRFPDHGCKLDTCHVKINLDTTGGRFVSKEHAQPDSTFRLASFSLRETNTNHKSLSEACVTRIKREQFVIALTLNRLV